MVTLPLRSPDVPAPTLNRTVPLPLPLTGDARLIQLTSVVAFQLQSVVVATLTLPLPPSLPTDWLDGVTSYRHAARCDTCTRLLSLMTMSPSRAAPASFAATRN